MPFWTPPGPPRPRPPASAPLVDRFLATVDRDPDEIIGSLEQAGRGRFGSGDTGQDEVFSRVLAAPRDVPVIVAGAKNAAISMVVRIFGEWSGTATPVGEKP